MKANFSKSFLAFVGTLVYLFLLVPFFIIWIPYEILSASGNDIALSNGVFQYVGFVFIALGVVAYIWCSGSFVFYAKGIADTFYANQRTCCNWTIQICKKSFVHSWNARIGRRDVAVSIYRYLHLYPYHVRRIQYPCSH
jgi:hypothetical protein